MWKLYKLRNRDTVRVSTNLFESNGFRATANWLGFEERKVLKSISPDHTIQGWPWHTGIREPVLGTCPHTALSLWHPAQFLKLPSPRFSRIWNQSSITSKLPTSLPSWKQHPPAHLSWIEQLAQTCPGQALCQASTVVLIWSRGFKAPSGLKGSVQALDRPCLCSLCSPQEPGSALCFPCN